MNIVSRYRPATQFRCLPLVGNSPFDYVQRLPAADGSNNYQPARDLVGAFVAMNEKGRKEWEKLTAGSKTAGASPSASSAGNQNRSALSICGLATHTSAPARFKSSSVTIEKLR